MKKKSAKTEETWMDGITTEMMEHICETCAGIQII